MFIDEVTKEQKEIFRKEVGKIVERVRLEKGLSRRELGEALGYQGNSAVQVIARIESGRAGIPKAKINKLIEILGMSNRDFGLGTTKSLKNFIAAGGFLGTPGKLLGATIVDMMDANEAAVAKQILSDDSDSVEEFEQKATDYFDVLRLMKIYCTQKKTVSYSLIEILDLVDNLVVGDDEKFADILATLNISPDDAYQAIETKLTEMLSEKNE